MPYNSKLVIIGDGAFAEVAAEYFREDSDYEVVGFAVERDFLQRSELLGLPVIAMEEMASIFPPNEHDAFAAITYNELNRLRTRLAAKAKSMGYGLASFISSHARIARSATLGEHCFVFEDNVIQPYVAIGNNVILWSGNHIGHHGSIADNCFVSSHVVVSGYCSIGQNCFFGVNSAVSNNIDIAADCWIGPGVVIAADTAKGQVYRTLKAEPAKVDAYRLFRVGN
jgi:sugar O-acyltransferase (sialic acid O-acetyltransferase NeuD family)